MFCFVEKNDILALYNYMFKEIVMATKHTKPLFKKYRRRKKQKWQNISQWFVVLVIGLLGLAGYQLDFLPVASNYAGQVPDGVREYENAAYLVVNENVPEFDESVLSTEAYESYSELDDLGRCGTAMANIGRELMPQEERGAIGQIKPSGWQTVRYDIVDGNYLYNRCHLIGYQLTGENANKQNLITGTRYLNVEGMLPFEDLVADYIKYTGNHVLYRVTPVFEGENLLASGVQMEAMSVEDHGQGVCFNVYVPNVQPGICIDYATGQSWLEEAS